MDIAKHIVQPLITAVVLGLFAGLMSRVKGEKRSRYFAYIIGCAGLIFMILGIISLLTRELEHLTGQVVFGILFVLFGVTCFFQTYTHMEIARLRKDLDSKKPEAEA
jgi:membrane-bound ClpP family serine protease